MISAITPDTAATTSRIAINGTELGSRASPTAIAQTLNVWMTSRSGGRPGLRSVGNRRRSHTYSADVAAIVALTEPARPMTGTSAKLSAMFIEAVPTATIGSARLFPEPANSCHMATSPMAGKTMNAVSATINCRSSGV